MSLLEKNTTREGRVDKTTSRLEFESDSGGKEYEVKVICNNTVYARESKGHLLGLYYLVL